MSDEQIAIDVRDVVKTYDNGRTRALDKVTLQVRAGEFVAIAGPSGCGKSTLLHAIAALERPDSGRIVVHGEVITERRDLSAYRARVIGLVFQLHNLLPSLSALENVQIPMYETGMSARQRRRKAEQLLSLVQLGDKASKRPPQLSGGERQRVAIARALANDPPIVLADEPTGNLDSEGGRNVLGVLRDVQRKRAVTLVLVTHDASIASSADRIVHMLDGRIVDRPEVAAAPSAPSSARLAPAKSADSTSGPVAEDRS